MNTNRLTPKQAAVLRFIQEHVERESRWPTYEAIRQHFGFAVDNSVTQNLDALERKGYLRKYGRGDYELTGKPVQVRSFGHRPQLSEA